MNKVYLGNPEITYEVSTYDVGKKRVIRRELDSLKEAVELHDKWSLLYGGASLVAVYHHNGREYLRVPVSNNGGTFPLFMDVSDEFLMKLLKGD